MARRTALLVAAMLLAVGCAAPPAGAGAGGPEEERSLRLYTSVTQETVDAVVAGYGEQHPDVDVEVFRAPTGELNARLAAERREGAVRADVLWLTDPLSMQAYDAQGLLAPLEGVEGLAAAGEHRTDAFVGTRLLSLVIVAQEGLEPMPRRWEDLGDPAHAGAVALPDPGFAGSAFAALGYFALADGDLGFFRELAGNGAVQVRAPDEVTTGVAQGRFRAGITIDSSVRTAVDKGSPVELVVPEGGAIAVYSPMAVTVSAADPRAAAELVEFTLSRAGQEAIAATGWQPIRDDVEWPHRWEQVAPDWAAVHDRQEQLLEEYRSILGG